MMKRKQIISSAFESNTNKMSNWNHQMKKGINTAHSFKQNLWAFEEGTESQKFSVTLFIHVHGDKLILIVKSKSALLSGNHIIVRNK